MALDSADAESRRKLLAMCADDCSAALQALAASAKSETDRKATELRLHARRGAARAQLGIIGLALEDMEAALALCTSRNEGDAMIPQLEADVAALREAEDELRRGVDEECQKRGADLCGEARWEDAVHFLSRALHLNPTRVHALQLRARALLHLGRPFECSDDCGAALALMREAGDFADPKMRVELLRLRATAASWQGRLDQAHSDLELAYRIHPSEQVQDELTLVASNQGALQSHAAARDRYADGRLPQAIELFTAALSLTPRNPALLSNRAAALLRAGRVSESLVDCELAVTLLRGRLEAPPNASATVSLDSLLGSANEQRIRAWLVTSLARRAGALCALGELEAARADLAAAAECGRSLREPDEAMLSELIALEEDMAAIDSRLAVV
jgi:tetratricopeptide (TPR) repeat protein